MLPAEIDPPGYRLASAPVAVQGNGLTWHAARGTRRCRKRHGHGDDGDGDCDAQLGGGSMFALQQGWRAASLH